MKLLLALLGAYALYRFARFVLEPDYVRCNCGAYWIDELEERLRNR